MTDERLLGLDFNDWPLPEAYLGELGRLSALWCGLEGQLDVCLGQVAGFSDLSDPRPFILLKHSSFPQKLDALAALCEQLAAQVPGLAEYSSTVTRLRTAQRLRNRFAHNGMVVNPETGRVEMAIGSARGKLNPQVAQESPGDVREAA